MLQQALLKKKISHTKKKAWYPIKPQLCYNGHVSTTDTISCHKMAVMEKFDCYSNYHTFIVVSKNLSFYWVKMNEVVPIED